MLRLIENMTLGRNAVAYLTESMHGAGSPLHKESKFQEKLILKKRRTCKKIVWNH